jgi:hypothetical protein
MNRMPPAPATSTNTKVLAPIGEGGGWFSMVSEITTAVAAVPIPHYSQGDKFLYICR